MTWKPQVTVLPQPKKTEEGPVATKTSLAALAPKTAAKVGTLWSCHRLPGSHDCVAIAGGCLLSLL